METNRIRNEAGNTPGLICVICVICGSLSLTAAHAERPYKPPTTQASVSARWNYQITSQPGTRRVRFITVLPRTIADRQSVRNLQLDPPPTSREKQAGNEYAVWDVQRPPPAMRITISADVDLLRCDLMSRRSASTKPARKNASSLGQWLKPEKHIESDNPAIRAAADKVGRADIQSTVRAIQEFVLKTLTPGTFESADRGAAWALANGSGDCSEYSDLFVALCRARQIPAFTCEGFLTTNVLPGDTPKHQWAEAYVDGLGWVAFDPFHAAKGSATFERLEPTRIITSLRRNDDALEGFHHWHYRYWGEAAEVSDAFHAVQHITP